ncbi:MAG: YabP/YqfC family sporulation protein [Christensenellales bacterium]|jgi:sporulation protein YabP
MQAAKPKGAHSLTMDDRARAVITGVEDVECFNEELAVVATSMGAITVTGANLRVSRLDLTEGKISIEGRIDSLEYGAARRGGFFSRILK